MRIYYSLGSSAPRTTTRNPFDYAGRNRQASRRYTLGVLSAGAEGELEQYPGQIRFRCACCGDCPPDDCARTCDNCYCDTSQQKYIVSFSEPPTMLDGSDCATCTTFGVSGDGCCGELCFTLVQNTASGSECDYISEEFQHCDITWRISYSVVANGPITLYNKDNPSQYAKWCFSATSVDPSSDTMACVDYDVPFDCSNERTTPFGKMNAGVLTRARWYKYEDSGAMPCNWMVGAYTGEPVIVTLRPRRDPETQCTPDTSTCNCVVCCDTPVRDLWITIEGIGKYGSNPTDYVNFSADGDDGCPDSETNPGMSCTGADCLDCSSINGVYHAKLKRPTPDSGNQDCCEWDFYQNESHVHGPYWDCGDEQTIGFFLTMCRDIKVCNGGLRDDQCLGNDTHPADSSMYTRFLMKFSDTNGDDPSYCFYKYYDQSDKDYAVGHSDEYCDEILEHADVINSPLCAFNPVVLDSYPGCSDGLYPFSLESLCQSSTCDGPRDAVFDVCWGVDGTATITTSDPGA